MDLRTYLIRKRQTITSFAKEVDYSRRYVNEIVAKRLPPGKKLARRIIEVTRGLVTLEDLFDLNQEFNDEFDIYRGDKKFLSLRASKNSIR